MKAIRMIQIHFMLFKTFKIISENHWPKSWKKLMLLNKTKCKGLQKSKTLLPLYKWRFKKIFKTWPISINQVQIR